MCKDSMGCGWEGWGWGGGGDIYRRRRGERPPFHTSSRDQPDERVKRRYTFSCGMQDVHQLGTENVHELQSQIVRAQERRAVPSTIRVTTKESENTQDAEWDRGRGEQDEGKGEQWTSGARQTCRRTRVPDPSASTSSTGQDRFAKDEINELIFFGQRHGVVDPFRPASPKIRASPRACP